MALLGNILWFVVVGWWNFILYSLLGVLFSITIIGIPIGKALFQYAKLMTLPFGKVIVNETFIKGEENVSTVRKVGGMIANIIWLPIGVITFIFNIALMIGCAITIIGIPAAVVIAKSSKFLLWPVGAKVITKEEADTIRLEKSLVKVAGTAMAVNSYKNQTSQQQIPIQPNQTLDSISTEGDKVLGNVKETGGKVVSSIAEVSGKTATVIIETSNAGMSKLKNVQQVTKERVLGQKKSISMDDILGQTEVKLYENNVMAWIMPFLEYITLAVAVLFMIIGIFQMKGSIIAGLLYGIKQAAPLMMLAAFWGFIKRNHFFVLTVLGVELAANLIFGFMKRGFPVVLILCYIGIIVWYVMAFVMNKGIELPNIQRPDDSATTNTLKKHFCSKCGAEYTRQVSFCTKCGNKM